MTKKKIIPPKKLYRHIRRLYGLPEILRTGIISNEGFKGTYGGISSEKGFYSLFGDVMIEFKGQALTDLNDMYPVIYDPQFFRKYPNARKMVRGRTDYDGPLKDLKYEHEYFSYKPIQFTPEMVSRIVIVYGMDAVEMKPSEIRKYLKENIPAVYLSKIRLVRLGQEVEE